MRVERSISRAVAVDQRPAPTMTESRLTAHSLSGTCISAAPMPPEMLNGFGHPQLSPMPATSPATMSAAWTARSGSELPSWKMRRDFSIG